LGLSFNVLEITVKPVINYKMLIGIIDYKRLGLLGGPLREVNGIKSSQWSGVSHFAVSSERSVAKKL